MKKSKSSDSHQKRKENSNLFRDIGTSDGYNCGWKNIDLSSRRQDREDEFSTRQQDREDEFPSRGQDREWQSQGRDSRLSGFSTPNSDMRQGSYTPEAKASGI